MGLVEKLLGNFSYAVPRWVEDKPAAMPYSDRQASVPTYTPRPYSAVTTSANQAGPAQTGGILPVREIVYTFKDFFQAIQNTEKSFQGKKISKQLSSDTYFAEKPSPVIQVKTTGPLDRVFSSNPDNSLLSATNRPSGTVQPVAYPKYDGNPPSTSLYEPRTVVPTYVPPPIPDLKVLPESEVEDSFKINGLKSIAADPEHKNSSQYSREQYELNKQNRNPGKAIADELTRGG